ncbi:MAG: VWA domain-containing protein [Anaerolineae bacterium]|nr:VWA domain-containing protein [Anaerolineae bacterium]
MIAFTTPAALFLLLGLPILFFWGWPKLKYRRLRDSISLIIRCLIFTLVVFALAGLQVSRGGDQLAVVFLIDHSDSVDQIGREQQLEYIREALQAMQPDDRAAIVVFGADAVVERPMSGIRDLTAIRSTPISGNTDLEEAISLGLALFPEDAARRMIILSDGAQTVGDAASAAGRAAATGVEISYVPIARDPSPEVRVLELRAPETVSAGQLFDIGISVEASEPTEAIITVLAENEVISREQRSLEAGVNNYALELQAADAGFRDFRVLVEPAQAADSYTQNNELAAFTRVDGPPSVLLVSQNDDDSQHIAEALSELGFNVTQMPPTSLPIGVAALESYDSVILANVPASQLSRRRMDALNSYVRDLGGGLVVVGGENTYAPGGYFQTPLEEALPVNMQLQDQQRIPQLTIAYVIDRSGSMTAVGPSGVENIELAKEAIIRSIDFLQPTDRAGVVSFDVDGIWIANVQPVLDRVGLQTQIASLRAGGGTDILAGMRLAAEALANDPSPRKHIILLTDGGATENGLVELTAELNEQYNTTTSVIAIGGGPAFLAQMAERGGGNYHEVSMVDAIPTIFTQETVLATRSYIIENEFTPTVFASSPILQGITSAPPLLGYIATSPKQTAQIILRGPAPYFDPILAQWQYGLGRSVAFTSDASRWGENWLTWDDFARFWSQLVQWTIIEGTIQNVESSIVMNGEAASLTVDARTDDGSFLNGLNLITSITPPEGQAFTVPVRQIAPGQYAADFTPASEGVYTVTLDGSDQNDGSLRQTTGWVMSYSPEYRASGLSDGLALLSQIAVETGGGSLADSPESAFAHTLQAQAGYSPIWPFLLLVAAVLLPFDVAVRRLIITRSDLRRARAALFGAPQAAAETAERMTALKTAKARANTEIPASPSSTAAALNAQRSSKPSDSPTIPDAVPTGAKPSQPAPTPTVTENKNVAGELLRRRKDKDQSA